MIKYVLFFILFLPCASAIAVSPTSLDLSDGSEGKVYIYNTLETEISIQVDGVYKENFTLAPEEKKILNISVQGQRPGSYEGQLIIKEVYENGFVNAIAIPVIYSGSFSLEKKELPYDLMFGLGLIIVVLLLFGFYMWKKKKR